MPDYAILMYPSYNRVYFQASKSLVAAELKIANTRLSQPCTDIEQRVYAGVDYITFHTDHPLSDNDIRIISMLSFVYAIFELNNQGRLVLYPVALNPMTCFDDDLVTILKYPGKTNETFTKLLINIGWLTSESINADKIHLLDPICGKGTSLFQGLIYGFDVSGVEIDKKAVQQAVTFFTKYLKTKRLKHKVSQSKFSENGKKICEITNYILAGTKDAYKKGDTLSASFYCGDTANTSKFIRKNSIDVIVGDLPYGVQHGSSIQKESFTRNPEALLRKSLPQWYKVLKPGGTLVLSWNTFVLKKELISDLLNMTGYTVFTGEPYDDFNHRVDQAILRDIIISKK